MPGIAEREMTMLYEIVTHAVMYGVEANSAADAFRIAVEDGEWPRDDRRVIRDGGWIVITSEHATDEIRIGTKS